MSTATALAKQNHNLRIKQKTTMQTAERVVVANGAALLMGALQKHDKMPITFGATNLPVKPAVAAAAYLLGSLAGGSVGRYLGHVGDAASIAYSFEAGLNGTLISGG